MITTAVDLFAGAGGLAEGLEQTGVKVVAASELHPQAALTHAFNHPDTRVYFGDVRELDPAVFLKAASDVAGRSEVDVVVGGPPCQGFSTAGKKRASDPRNNLFFAFVDVVAALKPKVFVLENVPGFKKMYGGRAFREATTAFSALGYELRHTILDAIEYGVPQRRKRFVMVGWLPEVIEGPAWPPPPTHLPERVSSPDLFHQGLLPHVTVEKALSDIAYLEPGWEANRHAEEPQYDYQRARRNGCALQFNHLATRHRQKAVTMFSYIPEGGTINAVPAEFRSAKRTMARWSRDKVSNTVLALPDDLIHYAHDRIPTVRELARLQSFDDDYVFIGKRTSGFKERRVDVPQYTQVGNAVPPVLGAVIGRWIQAAFCRQTRDIRKIEERRKRHAWVLGSSAFAGYELAAQAQGNIHLYSSSGQHPELPVGNEPQVLKRDPLVEWKRVLRSKRAGQWAPGVKARPVPAHSALPS